MITVQRYDPNGVAGERIEVPDEVLELSRGDQAVHDAVTLSRNAHRAGTASTLAKGEVSGSNRKPWRQKGTGRARAGYRQSPVWRGGGVAFGPRPRDFGGKINRKVARLALRRAFSERLAAGDVLVIDAIALEAPRTRLLVGLLKTMGIDRSCLLVTEPPFEDLARAARNLARVTLSSSRLVDPYTVLRCRKILMTRDAFDAVCRRMRKEENPAS